MQRIKISLQSISSPNEWFQKHSYKINEFTSYFENKCRKKNTMHLRLNQKNVVFICGMFTIDYSTVYARTLHNNLK